MNSDQQRVVNGLMAEINKEHGEESIVLGSEINKTVPRITSGDMALDWALGGGWPSNQWTEIVGNECLCPGTRVLRADLTWANIEDLCLGDEIVGFDEDPSGRGQGAASKFRRATVDSLGRKRLPSFSIRTRHGVVKASAGHMWLVVGRTCRKWVRTDKLQEGDVIASLGAPWETDTSWEAGYAAGFYDGEGCVARMSTGVNGGRVSMAQAKGETADYVERMLDKLGFPTNKLSVKASREHWQEKWCYRFAGRYEDMRFLGSIRPQRLLAKASTVWEGVSTKQVHGSNVAVLEIQPLGVKEVVTIGTSTKTLIAEGLLSHNSDGKTALLLKTIAANQNIDPEYLALWVAAEDFFMDWAETLGVDTDRILLLEMNGMKAVYNAVIKFLDQRAVDAIVIDSYPQLVPEDEDDGAMEDFQVGLAARLNGKFFRKQRPKLRRSLVSEDRPCTCFMVNQWREKIGVMYGDPRTTPGGRQKNYACAVRLDIHRTDWIKGRTADHFVGQVISAKTIKNKTAPRNRVAEIDFYFEDWGDFRAGDYDLGKEAITIGLERGLVELNKRTWSYHGEKIATSRDEAKAWFAENHDAMESLRQEVMAYLSAIAPEPPDPEDLEEPEPPSPKTRLRKVV